MNSALDKIPGQERVKQILNNFLQSNSIPHAFLFTGMEGVGKDLTAIQFAKALIETKNSKEPEKARRWIEQLQEPYIKLIFSLPRGKNEIDTSSPIEKLTQDEIELVREQIDIKAANAFHKFSIPKANLIKINSIRDIKKFLSMDYDEIGYRFVMISDAHLMNEESQNALLKSLEEPVEKVIFILTTPYISKLRSTIVSRCWRINFDPLSEDQIINILTEYFEFDKTTAAEVAPFAMGSVQYALNLNDINIHNLKEKTISILRYSFGRKFNSAFDELNSVISDQVQVVVECERHPQADTGRERAVGDQADAAKTQVVNNRLRTCPVRATQSCPSAQLLAHAPAMFHAGSPCGDPDTLDPGQRTNIDMCQRLRGKNR